MCDTFVGLPDVTLNGEVIFGKNSDRHAGEIQDLVMILSQTYDEKSCWNEVRVKNC